MAKMTIAQLREKEVDRLAHYNNSTPTDEDIQIARRLMNSFYRLCALDMRNCELSNDERTANKKYTLESEEKALKWYYRLDKEFNRLYGLRLIYAGICPTICEYENYCIKREVITRWFY